MAFFPERSQPLSHGLGHGLCFLFEWRPEKLERLLSNVDRLDVCLRENNNDQFTLYDIGMINVNINSPVKTLRIVDNEDQQHVAP